MSATATAGASTLDCGLWTGGLFSFRQKHFREQQQNRRRQRPLKLLVITTHQPFLALRFGQRGEALFIKRFHGVRPAQRQIKTSGRGGDLPEQRFVQMGFHHVAVRIADVIADCRSRP